MNLSPLFLAIEPSPRRIAVVRALPGLGDMLCSVPAFRTLRKAFPQAHLSLIGLPWATSFVERFKFYLDDLLEFPGYSGMEQPASARVSLPKFLGQIEEKPFDLVIQMHGSGQASNLFTRLVPARLKVGFYLPGQFQPTENEHFLAYPAHESEVWRNLRLLEFMGLKLQGDNLEFPVLAEDWQGLDSLRQEIKSPKALSPGQYVCIHPGASTPLRQWSPNQFAAIADALAAQGFQIVITGSAAELPLTSSIAQTMQAPALNLAGRTSLEVLAALLSKAALLICNDTGVSHLAAALQVPSVVIFMASDPARWAPLNQKLHRAICLPSAQPEACHHPNCGTNSSFNGCGENFLANNPAKFIITKSEDVAKEVLYQARSLLEGV